MYDVDTIRADFPILGREIHGRPLVYLDSAATSQKPRQVIEAISHYYETSNANIHRGIHTLAVEATDQYEAVRDMVARHIGASSRRSIVFTRNTTEAMNLVARTWAEANIAEGDEIVLTEMEHHSNIVPWQLLARRRGAAIRYIRIRPDGTLDLDHARELITSKTKVVSVVHMSNVLGTINPVEKLAAMAHEQGAMMFVDGAQSAPHLPLDVEALGCDFFAFSAHKMLGPTGVGVLWAREELLADMDPFLGGGEMIAVVRPDESTWAELPHKFEAGTPNIADVIAFGAALAYLGDLGMDAIAEHEQELTAYAIDRPRAVDGLRIHGPLEVEGRGGAISFSLEGIHPHDVSTIVDGRGIAIRAGHHCAQLLMRALNVPATSRASLYLYNTHDEVDALVEALEATKEVFKRDDRRTAV